jgi:hypothetical protein
VARDPRRPSPARRVSLAVMARLPDGRDFFGLRLQRRRTGEDPGGLQSAPAATRVAWRLPCTSSFRPSWSPRFSSPAATRRSLPPSRLIVVDGSNGVGGSCPARGNRSAIRWARRTIPGRSSGLPRVGEEGPRLARPTRAPPSRARRNPLTTARDVLSMRRPLGAASTRIIEPRTPAARKGASPTGRRGRSRAGSGTASPTPPDLGQSGVSRGMPPRFRRAPALRPCRRTRAECLPL